MTMCTNIDYIHPVDMKFISTTGCKLASLSYILPWQLMIAELTALLGIKAICI